MQKKNLSYNISLLLLMVLANVCFNQSQKQVSPGPNLPGDLVHYDTLDVFPGITLPKDQNMSTYGGYFYSGYIQLNQNKSLKYFLALKVGAEIDQTTQIPKYDGSDLIIWMNGGPGCSSTLGLFQENGPFIINNMVEEFQQVSFQLNKQSWNKFANVLYLVTPSGVGFSQYTSNQTQSDTTMGDDNRLALSIFLQTYQFQNRSVWIAGESYAGVYIPFFAYAIHNFNLKNKENQNAFINLKGWLAGNPLTYYDQIGMNGIDKTSMEVFNDFGMVQDSDYQNLIQQCQNENSPQCQAAIQQVAVTTKTDYFNEYNVPWNGYYDVKRVCLQDLLPISVPPIQQKKQANMFDNLRQEMALHQNQSAPHVDNNLGNPCIDSTALTLYFNNYTDNQNIREYLHITDNLTALTWSQCAFTSQIYWQSSPNASFWIYEILVPLNQYQILVYSGDTDTCIPTKRTKYWLKRIREDLNLNVQEAQRNFCYFEDQVGKTNCKVCGNYEKYSNSLNYVSVYGVGHMVPQWFPKCAYQMVYSFTQQNQELPNFAKLYDQM